MLHKLAREFNCAIVIANQVSDRFSAAPTSSAGGGVIGGRGLLSSTQHSGSLLSSSPASVSTQQGHPGDGGLALPPAVLSLDHQLNWFSGWGDQRDRATSEDQFGKKTPALGLTWANQVACRVALIKEVSHAEPTGAGGADWAPRRWRRFMRVVYAPWVAPIGEGDKGVEFEVWEGGLRAI